jgi:hypothetical protein
VVNELIAPKRVGNVRSMEDDDVWIYDFADDAEGGLEIVYGGRVNNLLNERERE